MQKSILIALTLCIVIQSAFAYDYIVFVQEPAGNICLLKDCKAAYEGSASHKLINMHGLWPNFNDGTYPATCTSEQYDESQIDPAVLSQMNQNWVGLYSSTQSFRSHEWTKHGTCYEQQQTKQAKDSQLLAKGFLQSNNQGSYDTKQNDFFKTVMEVKQKYDLTEAIYGDNLLQGNIYIQPTSQLRQAITTILGVDGFSLKCGTYQTKQILTEIWFCLDNNLKPMKCQNEKDTCRGEQIHAFGLNGNQAETQ